MDSERKTPSGGDCRPPRRRSSRPAGAPASAANRAPASSATPTQPTPRPTTIPHSAGTPRATTTPVRPTAVPRPTPNPHATTTPRPSATARATTPRPTAIPRPSATPRTTIPRPSAIPARTSTNTSRTSATPPRPTATPRPTSIPRNGAIVLDPNGVAGKAPKRYTRSSTQNNGRRPVTRSLTKSQVKRNRGRSYPETSAGGLVLRNMRRAYNPHTNRVYLSAVKVALIGRTDRRGRLLWSLPKGHIEDYETVPMTAVREVREETGIEGEIIKHLGTIDYWFLSDGKRIHKTVHHYLLRFVGGELSNADAEISEVKWVSMKDLPAHLSYADERKLARRATGVVAAWIRSEYGSGDGTGETIQIEGEYPDDDNLGDDLDEDDLLEPSYDEQNSSQGSAHHNGQTSAQNNGQNSGQRRNRRGRRRGGKRNRPRPTNGTTAAAGANGAAGGNPAARANSTAGARSTAGANRANSASATPGAHGSASANDANAANGTHGVNGTNSANETSGLPRKKRRRGHRGRGGRARRPNATTPNTSTQPPR